jgi:cytochrome c biogenesis protein CcmG/thiol:disulfide interchange protein DsbE
MKRTASRIPYLIALLVVGSVVLLAWINRDNMNPVIAGSPAPGFQAYTLDGDPVTLADHEGKVVMLNIWATWCPPCREEMPSLQRLYESLEGEDFEILAVSVDLNPGERDQFGRLSSDIGIFADSMGLTFPVLWDQDRLLEETYQTTGVPETFLIGRDGVIYKQVSGGTLWDSEDHMALIRRLLDS